MAVLRELQRRGRTPRLVSRTGRAPVPTGVDVVAADMADLRSAVEACRGASVVYLCAAPAYGDWPEAWPPLMHGAIEGAIAAGARLVFGDNLYMYGSVDGPLHERLPNAARGPKGLTRAIVASTLIEAHRSGKLQAAIARASDFYGPGVTSSALGEQVFGRALRGRPANLLGNPDVPHTVTYIDDFARALITLGEREEALGEVWHVPNAETVTLRRFVDMIFEETGYPPRMRVAPRWLVSALGLFDRRMRELKEMLYTFEQPLVVDHSRYAQTFGDDATPLREGIRRTVEWYRQRGGA